VKVSWFDVHVQTDGGPEAVSAFCLSGFGARNYIIANGTLGKALATPARFIAVTST
jgi:hypothetical protein